MPRTCISFSARNTTPDADVSAYVVMPASKPFDDAPASRVEHRGLGQHRRAGVGERADPRHERHPAKEPAHRGELQVGVGVDQPGEQDCVSQIDVGSRGPLVVRADVDDVAVRDRDRPIAHRLARDGDDPTRVVVDHA